MLVSMAGEGDTWGADGVCSGSETLGLSSPLSAVFGGENWRLAFLLSTEGDGLESVDLSLLLGLALPLGGDLAGAFLPAGAYNHLYILCLIIYSYEAASLTMCPGDEDVPAVRK